MGLRVFCVAAIAGLLIAAPASAQSPRQFDLICEGERVRELGGPAQPYSFGFRIDLERERWCWQACEKVLEFVSIHPDRLVFTDYDRGPLSDRRTARAEVSRTTGEYSQLSTITGLITRYYRVSGTCRPAPFSGFPATRF